MSVLFSAKTWMIEGHRMVARLSRSATDEEPTSPAELQTITATPSTSHPETVTTDTPTGNSTSQAWQASSLCRISSPSGRLRTGGGLSFANRHSARS
ncbi:hypothetical protein BGY98DRAFT_655099 [Russula aff. rugulosa BPL654]|nr:hypothetical protein BGY98DRAFT_655099 [Russula aff. rugulosa BPL654]